MNSPILDSQAARLEQMIGQQVRTWDVLDPRVLEAMFSVPRESFVSEPWRSLAYADCALPLPLGKRMLTPMMAGRILQALEPAAGESALEIGTGSGYLSACLAAMGARVRSLELHEEIAQLARRNLRSAGSPNVEVETADGATLAVEAAYDTIVLTGSLQVYDERYARALKDGGRLFVVVGQAPVMEARIVRRFGPDYRSTSLFETCLAPLEHIPVPEAFRF